jgi:hypothetical protein
LTTTSITNTTATISATVNTNGNTSLMATSGTITY